MSKPLAEESRPRETSVALLSIEHVLFLCLSGVCESSKFRIDGQLDNAGRNMKIDCLDTTKNVLIIAEIGNNHEGNFELAKRLIELAAKAGADIVKFQTIRADKFVSVKNQLRFETLKKFELSDEQHYQLSRTATDCGVVFLSTPFDLEGVDMLNTLVPAFKIASGDNTFFPLIERVGRTGKPIILSTGLTTLPEIERTKRCIEACWRDMKVGSELALLHCVVAYPTPPAQANLASIRELARTFDCVVGYSDHTLGIDAAVMSVALGARIIEKHFTIAKDHSSFRDHQLSADPTEFKLLVTRVREAEVLLGSGMKQPQEAELVNMVAARRSIVAASSLPAGHVLQWQDLLWMRPSGGISPGDEHLVLGKTLSRSIEKGDPILVDAVAA